MGFGVGLPRAAAQLQRHGADPAESQTPDEQLREVVDRLAMCPERLCADVQSDDGGVIGGDDVGIGEGPAGVSRR